MTVRKEYRTWALEALALDPRLGGVTQIKAWTGKTPARELPVLGVVTPQDKTRPGGLASRERAVLMQVVAQRLGGDDLQDELDLDADAIEAAVLGAFQAQRMNTITPQETSFVLNSDGENRVGTTVVTFEILYLKPVARPANRP